ncbi:MAG: lytic transglycosylase domain-containing protein [Candidatus Acidiferrales bacterium]
MMRLSAVILALAALFSPAARADYAVLRSGERLHIRGYERQGDRVRLVLDGGTVEVAAADLVAVEPEEVFTPAPDPAPAGPYGKIIRAAAQEQGVDEALISSVIATESNFNPKAVSRRQAVGLMQLRPETATRYSVSNAFDPTQNISAGTRYLKDLLQQYHGNLALALAAYNAGPHRVERYHGVPPYPETRSYVRRVAKKLTEQKTRKSAGAEKVGTAAVALQ